MGPFDGRPRPIRPRSYASSTRECVAFSQHKARDDCCLRKPDAEQISTFSNGPDSSIDRTHALSIPYRQPVVNLRQIAGGSLI